MALSPLHSIHAFSLLAVLAFNPFGCSDSHSDNSAPTPVSDPVAPPSGGNELPEGPSTGGGAPPPQGGTPEPATLLLLGGSAAGYLTLRRRRRAPAESTESQG